MSLRKENQLLILQAESRKSNIIKNDRNISNLVKRQVLRKLIKENTPCHHKHVYTQANFVCKNITISYESGSISEEQAVRLMLEAHDLMSHKGMSKKAIIRLINEKMAQTPNLI